MACGCNKKKTQTASAEQQNTVQSQTSVNETKTSQQSSTSTHPNNLDEMLRKIKKLRK